VRSRVARHGAIVCSFLIAACSTNLTYKFDAGDGEGGTLPDGALLDATTPDTRVPPDGAFPGCPGTAYFCDNFDESSHWDTLAWTILDRKFGPGNGAGFMASTTPRGNGKGLLLFGKGGAGGYAFPSQKFTRRGPDRTLSVRFMVAFLDARAGTFLELGDQDGPNKVLVSLRGGRLFVNELDTGQDVPVKDSSSFALEVIVADPGGTLQVKIPTVGFVQGLPGALPMDVEVRFGVTPFIDTVDLTGAMKVVVDDIVIE
jgi:hypothetical protein